MGTSPAVMSSIQSILNNLTVSTWDQADGIRSIDQYAKRDTIKYNADPLALVISQLEQGRALWEIAEFLKLKSTWTLLAQMDAVKKARDIRKYYRNKFTLQALKHGHNVSRFRQDLREFVDSDDIYTTYEGFIPMIVKLPDFYEEDKMMDGFMKEYNMSSDAYTRHDGAMTLYPLRQHRRKTSKTENLNFWFRDVSDRIYRISLSPKNELLHLFLREFAKDRVVVEAMYHPTKVRGQEYVFFNPGNWKLL